MFWFANIEYHHRHWNLLHSSIFPPLLIAQDGVTEDSGSTQPGETPSADGLGTGDTLPGETPSSGPETSNVGEETSNMGDEYQKVDYPVLYYHKTTGYYYDPVSVHNKCIVDYRAAEKQVLH